jgi:hypothetical protein
MTEILQRAVPFTLRADSADDGLTLEGYAAVFNSPTRIDSWEGVFDEQIARGAFRKTLRERTPKLMFEHGRHPMVGAMPLGTIERAREDDHGLFISARLADNWLVQPVRDAVASGAIDGMSFRFSVVRVTSDPPDGTPLKKGQVPLRTLQEVKLAEVGPVVFPAYEDTTVGVRSRQFIDELLGDDTTRVELARALIFGTDTGEPPDTGTPGEAATDAKPDVPSTPHIRSRAQRRAFARQFIEVT